MKKHFIPALLLAATLVMAGCNEREIATSSTSKPVSSQPQETSQVISSTEITSDVTPSSEPGSSALPSSAEVPSSGEVNPSSGESQPGSESISSSSSEEAQEVAVIMINGQIANIAPKEMSEGEARDNYVVYEGVQLNAEDKVKISIDGDFKHFYHWENADIDDGEEYTAEVKGTYTFWVNRTDKIWVHVDPDTTPVTHSFAIAVDGVALELQPSDLSDQEANNNDAAYKDVALEANQKVKITDNGTELHFWKWVANEAEENGGHSEDLGVEYTAEVKGTYTFWVNKDGKVWVDVVPDTTPVVHSYAIYGDGVAIDHALKEMTGQEANENNAIYEDVHLNAGVVVTIKDGDTLLHFCHWDELANEAVDEGTTFTAQASGKFTFWINKNNQVYYGNFQADPEPAISYSYYLVGAFNNYSLDGAPMFSAMGEESKVDGHTQYMVSEVTLALDFSVGATNDFKVTGVPDRGQAHVHFPAEGSGHTLAQAGKYNVYFVPEGNSAWTETYFYFEKLSDGEPQNALKVLVNGQEYAAENVVAQDDTQNVAVYEFVGAKDAHVTFTRDGNPMDIHHGDAAAVSTFQLPQDAKYTFYVNNSYEVYVVISPIMYMAIFDNSDRFDFVYANPANTSEGMYTVELEAEEALEFWTLDYETTVTSESLDPASPADIRADLALEYFVANQAGTYTFYIKNELGAFSVYVDGPRPIEVTPVTEYYLIGGNAEDGWTTLKETNKLTAMDDESKLEGHVQYHLDNVHLDQFGQYKIVGVTDGSDEWTYYPPSDGNNINNYFIETGGTYNVYFVAEGGHEAWSAGKGYMYCHLVEADAPAAVTYTDTVDPAFTGTGGSYTEWADKTDTSGVVYAGKTCVQNSAITFNSKNNIGIITTGNASGLKVKEISITFESHTAANKVLNVYGKNTAFASASELYGSDKGTLISGITYDGSAATVKITVTGDYQYIGFVSASGAIYASSIAIVWAA